MNIEALKEAHDLSLDGRDFAARQIILDVIANLEKEALSEPEQKYHRGDRLICLETEEYCIIHISGADRQWVKFPDSHIGVYTNEQVAELFELLHKEPEQETIKYVNKGETDRLIAQKQETIEGLNRDYDLLFAEHQLLLKKEWISLTQDELNMIGDSMRTWNSWAITDVYFAIETKLKDKNI